MQQVLPMSTQTRSSKLQRGYRTSASAASHLRAFAPPLGPLPASSVAWNRHA
jgi:hypothetical protein